MRRTIIMDLPLSDFRAHGGRRIRHQQSCWRTQPSRQPSAATRISRSSTWIRITTKARSIGEILDYMDDPVLQQLARSARQANAKSVGMLPAGVGYQDMGGRVHALRGTRHGKTEAGVQRDIALTRRWMDAIGIDVAVMFPTPMLQLGLHPQVEVEVALARAYNRWLIERVLAHEPRIRSMLYLPFNDADAAFQDRAGIRPKQGCRRLHGDVGALPPGAPQFLHEDLRPAGRE